MERNVEYYVAVGSNGIGYEHCYSNLKDARNYYKVEKGLGREVTLYSYNYKTSKKRIYNHTMR